MRCSVPRHPRLHWAVQAIGIILTSAVASLSAGSPARGDAIQYDSAKCSNSPGGMIYVAAGRHVYHQPFENLRYVHGVSLETAAGLPVPPRPWQPKGCPVHPLRGMGFKLGPFSDVTNPGAAETAIGGLVQLIEVDPISWWDTYERSSLSNPNPCAAGHARGTEVAPGLTVCRPAAAISPDRRSRLPFAAIVIPSTIPARSVNPWRYSAIPICRPTPMITSVRYPTNSITTWVSGTGFIPLWCRFPA